MGESRLVPELWGRAVGTPARALGDSCDSWNQCMARQFAQAVWLRQLGGAPPVGRRGSGRCRSCFSLKAVGAASSVKLVGSGRCPAGRAVGEYAPQMHQNHSGGLSARSLSCRCSAVQVIHLDVKSKVGLLGALKSCRLEAMVALERAADTHVLPPNSDWTVVSSTLNQLQAVHVAAAHLLQCT